MTPKPTTVEITPRALQDEESGQWHAAYMVTNGSGTGALVLFPTPHANERLALAEADRQAAKFLDAITRQHRVIPLRMTGDPTRN